MWGFDPNGPSRDAGSAVKRSKILERLACPHHTIRFQFFPPVRAAFPQPMFGDTDASARQRQSLIVAGCLGRSNARPSPAQLRLQLLNNIIGEARIGAATPATVDNEPPLSLCTSWFLVRHRYERFVMITRTESCRTAFSCPPIPSSQRPRTFNSCRKHMATDRVTLTLATPPDRRCGKRILARWSACSTGSRSSRRQRAALSA